MVPWRLWIPKISCTLADYFRLCRSEDNILYFQENVILHSSRHKWKKEKAVVFSCFCWLTLSWLTSSFKISKGGHTRGVAEEERDKALIIQDSHTALTFSDFLIIEEVKCFKLEV